MDSKFGAREFGDSSLFESDESEVEYDEASTSSADHSESDVSEILSDESKSNRTLSIIGKSLVFKGELTAAEDLLIQGQIKGSVKHNATNLTVGAHGKVDADIDANSVIVQGKVRGDIRGEKSIVVEPSARVQGNLYAPVIGLKEGAKFKGSIDMDAQARHEPASDRPKSNESAAKSTGQAGASSKSKSATRRSGRKSSAKKQGETADEAVDEILDDSA